MSKNVNENIDQQNTFRLVLQPLPTFKTRTGLTEEERAIAESIAPPNQKPDKGSGQ
jgi:hypothetical protein